MNMNGNQNNVLVMQRMLEAYMKKMKEMNGPNGSSQHPNVGNGPSNGPSSQTGFFNEQNGEIDFVNPTGSGGSWRGMNGGGSHGHGHNHSTPNHEGMLPPMGNMSTNHANGFGMNGQSFMNSSTASANFKCVECGLLKGTCHELEVHIKTEHLGWLPFQCPMCTAVRATDTQMHEHVHSHHKKNETKYIYLDNPPAKRMLQAMLDRALMGAAVSIARRLPSQATSGGPNLPAQAQNTPFSNGFGMNGPNRGFKRPRMNMNFGEEADISANYGDNERSSTQSPGDSDGAGEKFTPRASATVTVVPKRGPSAADAMLAQLNSQVNAGRVEDGSIDTGEDAPMHTHPRSITEGTGNPDEDLLESGMDVDEETSATLAKFFAQPKGEFDESNDGGDDQAGGDLLGNLTNIFGVQGHQMGGYGDMGKRKRAPRGSKGGVGSSARKRVLGECSKCHKPVTAGARQMHMFFHLGKDFNTYRFRCKFPDCTVEHYRKDQMENHHSKQHGRIDPDMMDDRSFELHNMVQELSQELLGTTGNTPGPTAAKAQIVYDAMQKEAAALAQAKKRKRNVNYADFLGLRSAYNSTSFSSSPPTMVKTQSPLDKLMESAKVGMNGTSKLALTKSNSGSYIDEEDVRDDEYGYLLDSKMDVKKIERSEAIKKMRANEEEIACQLCGKKLMNRIRGFHILWHLSNDLGIIRYSCKLCDFKHERPQSVSTHGKKEHGEEDCVEDSLYKYEDEVKSMSKACFGIEQLFAKEVRRRNKEEREAAIAEAEETYKNSISLFDEEAEAAEADENEDSQDSTNVLEKFALKYNLKQAKPSTPTSHAKTPTTGGSSTKKKISKRRFGHRRPMNKKKIADMVKLRAISFKIGGAQYFKKKINEAGHCEKCGKSTPSRMTNHAYSHLDDAQLYMCPHCSLGNWSRELVLKHIKDFHSSSKAPIDNRLKYAQEIKDMIKECYPTYFVDAPIPTQTDIEQLKKSLNLEDITLAGVNDEDGDAANDDDADADGDGDAANEDDETNSVADESEQVEDEQGEGDENEEHEDHDDDEGQDDVDGHNDSQDQEEAVDDEEEHVDEEEEEGAIHEED